MQSFSPRHASLWWTCFLLALFPARGWAASLTGAMIFSCDPAGNPAGNFVWDTRGLASDFYKLWLTRGVPQGDPDGLMGGFINGPTWEVAPIGLVLEEGTNRFTVFFQHNGNWPAFALHLFLESNTVPILSVKARSARTSSFPHSLPTVRGSRTASRATLRPMSPPPAQLPCKWTGLSS
jgi:hypothetical protein